MKLRTHPCQAVGCQRVISLRMLMCMEHWSLVPAPLQREVQRTRTEMATAFDRSATTRYRDAAARAVAAVKEKQERKAQAIAGSSGSLFT